MIKVGSARINEKGTTTGGKAGDQTGKEVAEQPFYWHKKGWICLRANDKNVAHRMARLMKQACDNNFIGYDQTRRSALRMQVLRNDYIDLTEVRSYTSCDCSELVRVCVMLASGFLQDIGDGKKPISFTTETMKDILLKTKAFAEIPFKSEKELEEGDILVTKTKGHTVIVTEAQREAGRKAKVTAWSLTVRSGPSANYKAVKWLSSGTVVDVYEEKSDGWLRIGTDLWINGKYTDDV